MAYGSHVVHVPFQANTAQEDATEASALARLHRSLVDDSMYLASLQNRMDLLADRVFGPQPKEVVADGGAQSGTTPLIGALGIAQKALRGQLEHLEKILCRLEEL